MRSTRRHWLRCAATFAASGIGHPLVRAQTSSAIVLGHTYPASGIFADTAMEMKTAIDGAISAVNAAGGIGGRPVRVVSLDDGYDPQRSVANAEALRIEHGAVALLAPVGAPNLAALMPWAERQRIPLIGARSGADSQRGYHRYVFFVIGSFGDEVRHIARHLDTIGTRRIAIATMDNPTGNDIARQFSATAQEHRLQELASLRFDLSGKNSGEVARRLVEARPQAVLLAGGGEGAIAVVGALLEAGLPASTLYCVSLLQPQQLHRRLGDRSNGIVFTQVVPQLDDRRLPIMVQYRQALQTSPGARATSFGFEGYLAAQVALRGLASTTGPATSTALASALERLGTFEVGGVRLQYDGSSHHGTRYVDLGILSRGRVTR
ncbi:ABC transporter substrate-binding protein [Variovorax terrae]|uniref:ABC transporter substrate-binding protein n=1 Tax=Variovorax terrae TaxID=2923278 RepID=A0A9X1VRH8_9BURK|nr:ABC transporter substrate-binding protein [Variovorax terrae]MCJ0761595.1 ABC transporter substrate-binding protein [Variovorax terrae]